MVKNKTHLLEATNKIVNELGKDELDENSTKEQKVSKIFFVSALKSNFFLISLILIQNSLIDAHKKWKNRKNQLI